MIDSASDVFIGIMIGIVLGFIVFLTRQDFLQQQCDNQLIKENKPRNFVCVVRMRATVVNNLKSKEGSDE